MGTVGSYRHCDVQCLVFRGEHAGRAREIVETGGCVSSINHHRLAALHSIISALLLKPYATSHCGVLGSCLIPHSCAPMCTLQRILHAAARFPGPVAVAAFNSIADVPKLVFKQRILSMPQPDSLAMLPSLPSTRRRCQAWFGSYLNLQQSI